MSYPKIDELTEDYGNLRIEIHYDEDPVNPLTDWDSLTTIRGWHRRMEIGHGPNLNADEYSLTEMIEQVIEEDGPIVFLAPLHWYEHSGATCSMGTPMSLSAKQIDAADLAEFRARCLDDAGWDSGVAGLVYVTAKSQATIGTPDDLLEEAARGEVKTYADYLEGQVYGYVVSEVTECDHGDEHADVLDSLWGMFGGDEGTDYPLQEARGYVGSSVIPWLRLA